MGRNSQEILDHDYAGNTGELQELLQEGKDILNAAINISGRMETAMTDIDGIYAGIGGDVRVSGLGSSLSAMRGTLVKDSYLEMIERMDRLIGKLLSDLPDYDCRLAGQMDELSGILNAVKGRIADLEGLLISGDTGISYKDFSARLSEVKKAWDKTSQDLAKHLKEIEAGMLGVAVSAARYSEDPVNLSTGNFVYDHEDMQTGGEIPLSFHRYYNAKDHAKGSMGRCFLHNYEVTLSENDDGIVTVRMPDGQRRTFVETFDGNYRGRNCDAKDILLKSTGEGGWEFRCSDGKVYKFATGGCLLRQENACGRGIAFTYDGKGQLLKAVTDTGSYFKYEYDEKGKLICVSDHTERKVLITYEKNKPASVILPDQTALHYGYGRNGRISETVNAVETVTVKNTFDENLRVVRQEFPDGSGMSYQYDDEAGSVTLTERNGSQTVYLHDKAYRLVRILYQDGTEESFSYNDKNQCISTSDRRGNVRRMAYDDRGNLTQTADALGRKVNLTYDRECRLLKVSVNGREELKNRYDGKGNLVRTERSDGTGMTFSYDNCGRPAEITLADGSHVEFSYDERGNMSRIRNAAGAEIGYLYDNLNRVVETSDANGNKTHYDYDMLNRIIKVINAEGNCRSYVYGKSGNVTEVMDFDGHRIHASYNSINRMEQITDKEGNRTEFSYDRMWNISEVRTADGGKTSYIYNADNRLTEERLPSGGSLFYEYDAEGNRTGVTDAEGNKTLYVYDVLNRVTEITEPDGGKTLYEYDAEGNLTKIRDALGQSWFYTYDTAGRHTSETNPLGETTSFLYDDMGHVTRVCYPNGLYMEYIYGPGGRLKEVKYPDGTKERYAYDGNGNLIRRKDRFGGIFLLEYDCLNRIISVTDAAGGVRRYTYDTAGNVIRYTDENGNPTSYEYSPNGNLLKVTDALFNETKYSYDVMGHLICMEQTGNNGEEPEKTEYEWGLAGLLSHWQDALGNKETYEYDLNGRLREKTDREGNRTKFAYDHAGNVTNILYADGRQVELSYNALHQLEEMKDWLGKTKINLDALGRPLAVTGPDQKTVGYEWGSMGERKALIYPDGERAEYLYNEKMQLAGLLAGGEAVSYAYDASGRLIGKSFSNGVGTEYAYDAVGRMTKLVHRSGGKILSAYGYAYDAAGNRIGINRERQGAMDSGKYQYIYDAMNRLTETIKDGESLRLYAYDAFGNRIRKTDYIEGRDVRTDYTYNSLGQLIKETGLYGEKSYEYDKCGSLIRVCGGEKLLKQFSYDTSGRMEYSDVYADGGLAEAVYQYNGLGQRTKQVLSWTDRGSEELINPDAAGRSRREIAYTPDLTRQYRNLLGLAMKGGQTVREQKFYWDTNVAMAKEESGISVFMQDVLGSPQELLDETGQCRETYAFDEFGIPLDEKLPENTGLHFGEALAEHIQPFGFTGYQMDAAGSLYFAQARRYDAGTGRFVSEDLMRGVIAAPYTLNRYGYCWNKPVDLVDLNGMWPEWLENIKDFWNEHIYGTTTTIQEYSYDTDLNALGGVYIKSSGTTSVHEGGNILVLGNSVKNDGTSTQNFSINVPETYTGVPNLSVGGQCGIDKISGGLNLSIGFTNIFKVSLNISLGEDEWLGVKANIDVGKSGDTVGAGADLSLNPDSQWKFHVHENKKINNVNNYMEAGVYVSTAPVYAVVGIAVAVYYLVTTGTVPGWVYDICNKVSQQAQNCIK